MGAERPRWRSFSPAGCVSVCSATVQLDLHHDLHLSHTLNMKAGSRGRSRRSGRESRLLETAVMAAAPSATFFLQESLQSCFTVR